MAKLARDRHIAYIDASFGAVSGPNWFKIGKSLESFVIELNPDVSTTKNIWLENTVEDNGYSPSAEVDPYYADPSDSIYAKLKDIAMNRLVGDDCKTKFMEVIVSDDTAETHEAWTEDIIVKTNSVGGDTNGFAIPYTIHFDGNRTKGNVEFSNDDYKTGTPSFTAIQ